MIGECLDEEREFGIVWLSDDGLKEIGCTAQVAQLLEQMDDGRMNILVRAPRPSGWCDGSRSCPTPPVTSSCSTRRRPNRPRPGRGGA